MTEEHPQKNSSRSVLRFLSRSAGKNKLRIAALTLMQMISGACTVLYALLLRELVNAAVVGSAHHFWHTVTFFAILTVSHLILLAGRNYLTEFTRAGMENAFKQRLLDALLTRDFAAVTAVHSAKWMNRLTSDTVVVANHMTDLLPGTLGMLVQFAGALWALLALEPRLAWIIFPLGILLLAFSALFRRKMKTLHKNVQEADGELRMTMQEQLTGMTVVRAYSGEEQAEHQAARRMDAHKKARMHKSLFSSFCNFGFQTAMRGGMLAGAVFCGYGILSGTMSVGNLVAVMQLIGQVQGPAANISGLIPRYYAMTASAERLMDAEDLPRELENKPADEKKAREFYCKKLDSLTLRNVSFSYEGEQKAVLQDYSLKVRKREYVAFTGHSGCGKSTVFRLLLGLYRPQEGRCAAEATDGSLQDLRVYRRMFAYVPQGKFFMSGTIRDAVTFAESGKQDQEEKIWKALDLSCAADFVKKLPDGLDTVLGEQGLGLSEGQLQRLAIARALYSDRPVLLLDEATSALDEETESRVLTNLRSMTDKTVLIVTHRPAALAICDRVESFEK